MYTFTFATSNVLQRYEISVHKAKKLLSNSLFSVLWCSLTSGEKLVTLINMRINKTDYTRYNNYSEI